AMTGALSVADVGVTLGKLGAFLAVVLVVGLIAVPRLISYVAKFKSNEMLIITILGLCFGVSLLAVKLGYSVALGAFIIGAVIAETREIHRIETLIEPVRDMFSAIFFVAIGLLIDPKMLIVYWQPILAITVAVVAGKVLTCSFGVFLGGNDTRTSLRVGMGMAQIGEFSFIIASLGVSLKVTSSFLYPIAVAVSAITTLFTPYLIRSSDRVVTMFDRRAPKGVVDSLNLYTRWVGQIGSQRSHNRARGLMWKWAAQMALNAALIAAVFIAAVFVGKHPPEPLRALKLPDHWLRSALWLAAVLCSLPMFIATFRKLQALGLLLAEMKVTQAAAGERTAAIRSVVAGVVPFAGSAALSLFVLVLSSALLPPLNVLLVLLLVIGLIAWLMWRSFIRVYSRAQFALYETFAQPADPKQPSNPAALPPLLQEADLDTVVIAAGSPFVAKQIRELALRTATGASIVGIEREGPNIINPGPDEEIQAEDRVLLLGRPDQLAAAKKFLQGEKPPKT
ncbi:MAG: cation:proton antiporter, partial [Akkermansiaceae bacterium]|nr:cation:proton antiporter [Verrucomicrobiales bacterium]